jgi:hypothetical protein
LLVVAVAVPSPLQAAPAWNTHAYSAGHSEPNRFANPAQPDATDLDTNTDGNSVATHAHSDFTDPDCHGDPMETHSHSAIADADTNPHAAETGNTDADYAKADADADSPASDSLSHETALTHASASESVAHPDSGEADSEPDQTASFASNEAETDSDAVSQG